VRTLHARQNAFPEAFEAAARLRCLKARCSLCTAAIDKEHPGEYNGTINFPESRFVCFVYGPFKNHFKPQPQTSPSTTCHVG
jgi:hypothetical protein